MGPEGTDFPGEVGGVTAAVCVSIMEAVSIVKSAVSLDVENGHNRVAKRTHRLATRTTHRKSPRLSNTQTLNKSKRIWRAVGHHPQM